MPTSPPSDAPGPHEPDTAAVLPVRRRGLVPRALLDENALKVVARLQRSGHEAYLVGGCVRDLIAGAEPKDFDVATDATPGRIKRLFRNARIIGRRFRLAHIRFGPDAVVETATFRADPGQAEEGEGGEAVDTAPRETDENLFGTAPEDARRRDFTVNALFYDPVRDEVVDWVGGLADLEDGVIRAIGDPVTRLREDPVRMIRAVHFAERLGFRLEAGLEAGIRSVAPALAEASPARLYVELHKVLRRGAAHDTLRRLHELGVLAVWMPELADLLTAAATWPSTDGGTHEEAQHGEPEDAPAAHVTWNLLGAGDRVLPGLAAPSEALLLAPLLVPWILAAWRKSPAQGWGAFADVFDETVRPLAVRMSMPRRTVARLRDLAWALPLLRHPPSGKGARRLARRPGFGEALTLLALDLDARDSDVAVLEAWRELAGPEAFAPREREPRGRRERGRGGRGRGRDRGRRRGGRDAPSRSGEGERGIGAEAAAWAEPPEV